MRRTPATTRVRLYHARDAGGQAQKPVARRAPLGSCSRPLRGRRQAPMRCDSDRRLERNADGNSGRSKRTDPVTLLARPELAKDDVRGRRPWAVSASRATFFLTGERVRAIFAVAGTVVLSRRCRSLRPIVGGFNGQTRCSGPADREVLINVSSEPGPGRPLTRLSFDAPVVFSQGRDLDGAKPVRGGEQLCQESDG
jgi:hypothetical protein